MDRPEPVSRVMPPITTIAKTKRQPVYSQIIMCLFELIIYALSTNMASKFVLDFVKISGGDKIKYSKIVLIIKNAL